MNNYSTLFYNRKHLIIKSVESKEPFVVAECFLPEMAQRICDLLTKHEAEKLEKEKSNES